MSTSSVGNAALESLIAQYTAYEKEDTNANDEIGSEDFLTLLVAQLENQNPLDPADTSQFTDQLAQFTQVEQLINLNGKMDEMLKTAADSDSATNATDYVGMQVTAIANTMTVEDGSVTSGFYTLSKPADVVVVIQDENGNTVKTLEEGQQEAGSYLIAWDGTDANGDAVDEGTYTYTVMANAGSGYEKVTSTITGTVNSVVYQNGKPYLVVGGVLLDPSSVTSVTEPENSSDDDATSIMDYLGRTVSSNYPIVRVAEGQINGGDLNFHLETSEAVTITIYNANNEVVATIEVDEADTTTGDNTVPWDATSDTGYGVSDGLYYYTVKTASGSYATTPISGEVTAIQIVNGVQYLELGESGRLVSLSTVTSVR
ncbi:FlgD immunoglobulin-like domain containing protein [Desulfospira joergensenii]|uniref:FlgD immunoglobulin-like domain containing protein n=1 Tax=Desulfospira joergensenii TaxID=53329 RepID=UPI0003B3A0C4|nr:FlgD immunoglobulin-like domain containing protein [Desulfospira joergensenii]